MKALGMLEENMENAKRASKFTFFVACIKVGFLELQVSCEYISNQKNVFNSNAFGRNFITILYNICVCHGQNSFNIVN